MNLVQGFDDLLVEGDGDNDPGLAGGCVVVEHILGGQAFGHAGEAGGAEQELDIFALLLGRGELVHGAEGQGAELLKHIAGEGIGNNVVRAGDVVDVQGVFTDVGDLACLTGRPGLTLPHKGLHEWAVIGEDVEHAAGEHVAEVSDAEEESQHLAVERGVVHLGGSELSGPELEGPPGAVCELL